MVPSDMDKQPVQEDLHSVKEYPPSEIYTSDPPPAYMKPRTSAVQIARIAAVTLVAVSFILGFFMLASSYVTATLSCDYQPFPHQDLVEERPMFQQLVDPLESEETKQPRHTQEAASEQQEETLKIKLPLQLDFDDIAGAMMDRNTKSRMNCVVEKRRAEEVLDHQPKTVRLPFGVNLTTDPRYEHVTGERMAIFCESGNQHRESPREQLTPIVVPIAVPHPVPQRPQQTAASHAMPHLVHLPPMPQHVPQPMPQHIPQAMPQRMAQAMPQHMPQAMPQHMPQHIPMPQMQPQTPHIPQFLPQMQQVPQGPRFFPLPQQGQRMQVRPQDELPLHIVRELFPFLDEGDNRIDLVEAGPQIVEARQHVIDANPHLIEARPHVLEARPQVIQARPIQVVEAIEGHEEGRQVVAEGRAMHVPHQLEGVPVPAEDVRPPPLPQTVFRDQARPHFVQPRSIRSVDQLLHKRDKRVRRCACDCAC